jgi:hypothetical protein
MKEMNVRLLFVELPLLEEEFAATDVLQKAKGM